MNQNSFRDVIKTLENGVLNNAVARVNSATEADVIGALSSVPVSFDGYLALISSATDSVVGEVETEARNLTEQRFGRTINLYKPLYISNSCINGCLYCGFSRDENIKRKTLSIAEVEREGETIFAEGYRNILLVAGEDKRSVPVSFIEECVKLFKKIGFAFVSMETQAMTEEEYRRLGSAGLDGVTIYQETYDRKIYETVHPSGPKKDYDWRIDAPERVARAGIRSVGMGVLLGLGDFTRDAITLASHIKYIQKKYWQTAVAVSFPRIHATPTGFELTNVISDEQLVRLILAMRLANPDSLLTLSTREGAKLRDRLFGVGINQASAGSKTNPGGYAGVEAEDSAGEQFPVVDDRTPGEVVEALKSRGLEWVWKDWDVNLKPVT